MTDTFETLDISRIKEFFPNESFRPGQQASIQFALEQFNEGKRFVVLECPTGGGKSAIGIGIARFFEQSYYLTIQKILQSQLSADYGELGRHGDKGVVELKGRSNYPCTLYQREGQKLLKIGAIIRDDLRAKLAQPPSCAEGYCKKLLKAKCDLCRLQVANAYEKYSLCPYFEQVGKAVNAQITLMNFSSFLCQTRINRNFSQRPLLLIDEAHQTESQLLDFISISFNDRLLRTYGFELRRFDTVVEYWLYFKEQELTTKVAHIIKDASQNMDQKTLEYFSNLYSKLRALDQQMEAQEEWVSDYIEKDGTTTVTLRPVFVSNYAEQYLFSFGQRVLLMSATILDVNIFCKSLGIPMAATAPYRMKSRFPVKHRPIYYRPKGEFRGGKRGLEQWGPILVKAVDEILESYGHFRGIIHTHNFAIAKLIMQDSRYKSRLLFQEQYSSKDEMLDEHRKRTNSVLVAPALHEGLSLDDDLSRFQIICKVPWPNYFDDKQLARRVELDSRYLSWLTALKLVQSAGRSVRSEKDWAHTYIIDTMFRRFALESEQMLPKWFNESIIWDQKVKPQIPKQAVFT